MDFTTFDELFSVDESKSQNGVPIEAGLNHKDEPIIFYISDISSVPAQKIFRKYDKAFESSRHIPKKRSLVWSRFIAEAVLKDWKGVIDKDGNEIPATKENKIAVLSRYEKFLSIVLEETNRSDNFRPDTDVNPENGLSGEEDSEKN